MLKTLSDSLKSPVIAGDNVSLPSLLQTEIQHFSIDTRTLLPGSVFIAIKGPAHDGHEYIDNAFQKGAVVALTTKPIDSKYPHILVEESIQALTTMAAWRRSLFTKPVIAVTGSCGKTTTKTMIASILEQMAPTLATEGTLNNHIGLPLTLLRLTAKHDYAVLELGANHIGEIEQLTALAKPNVALINNVHPCHLSGFGSLQGIAKAKGEIFSSLAADGTAVWFAESEYADYWKSLLKNQLIITFGFSPDATIYASDISMGDDDMPEFILHIGHREQKIKLNVVGPQNIHNALAAAACTYAVGAPIETIAQGLEAMTAVTRRLNVLKGLNNAIIINDSYNANPIAVKAALDILARKKGKKIFVFGDMGELGEESHDYHQLIGEQAKALGVDHLLAVGELTMASVNSFGAGAQHFDSQTVLLDTLKPLLDAQTTVLVKGSKSQKMWQVVEALC